MTHRTESGAAVGGAHGRAGTGDNPRVVAHQVLTAVTRDDAYANLVLPTLLARHGLTGRDAAFATELSYGTLRRRGTLDRIIATAARRELTAIDQPVLETLRLGAYQLLCTRVAVHAAVDTTVSLARTVCGHKPAGFVNAVMRKISQRGPGEWLDSIATGDPVTDLGLEFSHPSWVVAAIAEALGVDVTVDGFDDTELAAALGADNEAPEVGLCARPGRITTEELARQCGGRPTEWSPYGVQLPGGDPGDVTAVTDRRAHVQDEGSQLVALVAAGAAVTGSDTRWLDLCAGPGGKAALLGALAAERGARLTAVEVSEHRAALVSGATRGLPVEVVHADGREFGGQAQYDRVLLDAPCSGLGALRRRPEARWRKQPGDVVDLTVLQRQLLTAALRLVRPGGVVCYVTCSPVLAETEQVVDTAVGVETIDVRPLLPPGMPGLGDGPSVQLWPHRHRTDAMFCAVLRRH